MRIAYILFVLLFVSSVSASLEVDITLSDGFVRESFTYTGEAGLLRFDLPSEPVSVVTSEGYTLEGSTLFIDTNATPVRFSALFDDLVVESGSQRVFRSSFSSDLVNVSIVLPEGATLIESVPIGDLSTDGTRIRISWPSSSERSVAVFYEVPERVPIMRYVLIAVSLIIAGALIAFVMHRRSKKRTIDALISADEREVLERVDGTRTQQDIARELSFSKSKMSKVVRKLEEKGLVGKVPHFKTNRLKRL